VYGYRAEDRRRCLAITKNGEPCRQWAMWDDPEGACYAHANPRTRRNRRVGAPPCTCPAYQWPHRPGGGLCRWPDPPHYRSPIPTGTHSPDRSNSAITRWARAVLGGYWLGGHGLSDLERRRLNGDDATEGRENDSPT
jgi:hypothetical protein